MQNTGIEIFYLYDTLHGNSTFDSRYKFTGKEHDTETDYTYFGARYYDSDLSMWLSVDPLASKYPSLSPFAYVANNPIRLVDPDGMQIDEWEFNLNTAQMNRVGSRDGDETQHIKFVKGSQSKEVSLDVSREQLLNYNSENNTAENNNTGNDYYNFSKSLDNAGDVAGIIVQIFVKVFPPTATIDASKTIMTGVDINENVQEGAFNRYISPSITILSAGSLFSTTLTGPDEISNILQYAGWGNDVNNIRKETNSHLNDKKSK